MQPYWIVCCVIACLWILRLALRFRGKDIKKMRVCTGVPGFDLFYASHRDADGGLHSHMLESTRYGLRGKPDAIYKAKHGTALIPAELKSGAIGGSETPYRGDLMQLAAYFLLIEDYYNVRPKFGHLIYSDFMFKVKNTRKLQRELSSVIRDMKRMLKTGSEEVNPDFAKCKSCVCRGTVCEFMN